MPAFWRDWTPHLVPFTYIVEGLLVSAIGNGKEIVCRESEFAVIQPTDEQSCEAFLEPFLSSAGGYVNNPDATSDCQYCQYRTGDEYLKTVEFSWSNRAADIGYLFAYIGFNVSLIHHTHLAV